MMAVAMGEIRVGGDLWVVVSTKVMTQLMTEAKVAEGAGLGGDGDSPATVVLS